MRSLVPTTLAALALGLAAAGCGAGADSDSASTTQAIPAQATATATQAAGPELADMVEDVLPSPRVWPRSRHGQARSAKTQT